MDGRPVARQEGGTFRESGGSCVLLCWGHELHMARCSACALVFLRTAGDMRPVPVQASLTNGRRCPMTAMSIHKQFHFVEENHR